MRGIIPLVLVACGGSSAGKPDAAVATPDAVPEGPLLCGHPRPGPSNTGVPAGVTLAPSGSITADMPGQIIEDLDIAGSVTVLADNVTIRRVRITSDDYYPIRYFDNNNTGLLVEDSEIVGTSDDVTSSLAFASYTARRLDIHGGADGFKADSNAVIESSWIHDLRNGPDQHNDGVQSTGGKGVTLRYNFISGASNAAVQTGDESGSATEGLTIDCNWLFGGGWTLNIRGTGATAPSHTTITNNRFRDSGYGPWTLDDPNPTISGNVDDATDQPITDP